MERISTWSEGREPTPVCLGCGVAMAARVGGYECSSCGTTSGPDRGAR
jgi:hypothetical protein